MLKNTVEHIVERSVLVFCLVLCLRLVFRRSVGTKADYMLVILLITNPFKAI